MDYTRLYKDPSGMGPVASMYSLGFPRIRSTFTGFIRVV